MFFHMFMIVACATLLVGGAFAQAPAPAPEAGVGACCNAAPSWCSDKSLVGSLSISGSGKVQVEPDMGTVSPEIRLSRLPRRLDIGLAQLVPASGRDHQAEM